MIIEVTSIKIQAEKNNIFEKEIQDAAKKFILTFPGCLGYSIRNEVENPLGYAIEIRWKSLEDHLEHFRKSDAFVAWRASISSYFSEPPTTTHYSVVAVSEY